MLPQGNISKTSPVSIILFIIVLSLFVILTSPELARAANCEESSSLQPAGEFAGRQICASTYSNLLYIYDDNGDLVRLLSSSLDSNGNPMTGRPFEEGQNEEGLNGSGEPVSCSGLEGYWNHPVRCIGRTISVIAGTSFISLTAWLLAIAGLLFDFVINKTIVQFGSFFNDSLRGGIEAGWTAFRDIANIVIIGMFVFIAISLILGLKEYGEKKMIARVLVIAVLINFSLLFTKMIIDASNFTAKQFYTAASLPSTPTSPDGTYVTDVSTDPAAILAVNDDFSQQGIAGKFINYMGITSIGNTWEALSSTAFGSEEVDYADADGWKALLHGLFSATLLLGAALVFLYGAFMLSVRALLFIFLLLTSALAFASWLIPKLEHQGWKAWWDALIRNALLAPLLMLMLWATLQVGEAVKETEGTLGDLLTQPTNSANLQALFAYIIVIGLLFFSIRFSSMLAGTITGFSTTAGLAAAPFTLGSRFLAAPFLRSAGGLLGSRYQQSRLAQAKTAGNQAAGARVRAQDLRDQGGVWNRLRARRQENIANRLDRRAALKTLRAGRGEAVAKSKMNVMDTGLAKAMAGAAGIPGWARGTSAKGTKTRQEIIKEKAKSAEQKAAKFAPSSDELRLARERVQAERDQGYRTRDANKKSAEAIQRAVENAKSQEAGRIQTQINTTEDEARAARMRGEDAHIKEAQAAALRRRLERIDEEEFTVNVDGRSIRSSSQDARNRHSETAEALHAYREETSRQMGNIETALKGVGSNVAEAIGRREGNVLERSLGVLTGANRDAGKAARELYTKKRSAEGRLQSALNDLREDSSSTQAQSSPPSGNQQTT